MRLPAIYRAIALLALPSGSLLAQTPPPSRHIAAREIVALVSDQTNMLPGPAILANLTAPDVPRARKDSIAFGLRDLALTSSRTAVRSDAVMWLTSAAKRGSKTPYEKSSELLMDIYKSDADVGTRGGALRGLAQIGTMQNFKFVADVIEDPALQDISILPLAAVDALATFGGQPGRDVLRTVFARGRVTNMRARAMLWGLSQSDFKKPPK